MVRAVDDQPKDIKKEVTEIKFLIHDLRVERFINEIIHFHVTVDTDLEIYSVDQAKAMHGEDLQELKDKAVSQRKTFQEYCNAVQSLSPQKVILDAGTRYVATIYDICELILDPRWGRADQVLSFLPRDARSARSHVHYMNCIRWICGVYYRIQHFMEEKKNETLYEEFDLSEEIQDFVRNVIYGYVTEKSSARVEIQLDRLDSVVVGGNRYRFRRMFFNLVMNAVDAMSNRRVGVLNITDVVEDDRVVLRVRDNGSGMPPEKLEELLEDKESLDGELHSLGFVFVRQTIAEFGGEVSIQSEANKGTTVAVALPYIIGGKPAPRKASECEKLDLLREVDEVRLQGLSAYATKVLAPADDQHQSCGEIVYADYKFSEAQFPGSIFGIGVTADGKVDFFTHRPYERDWNITHEDLSPMFFEAIVRGRVEEDEDEDKTPVLILKAPQNVREYFDFRDVPEKDRNPDRYVGMVHDEYILVARKLMETGMSAQIGVRVTDLDKFFPRQKEDLEGDSFELEMLAKQSLISEMTGETGFT